MSADWRAAKLACESALDVYGGDDIGRPPELWSVEHQLALYLAQALRALDDANAVRLAALEAVGIAIEGNAQRLFELCAKHGGTEAMMLTQEVVAALAASRVQAEALAEKAQALADTLQPADRWPTDPRDVNTMAKALASLLVVLAAYRKGLG